MNKRRTISDLYSDDTDDGEVEESLGKRPWDEPDESEPEEEARPAEDILKLSQYECDRLITIADTMALIAAAGLNMPPMLKPAKHVTDTTKYDALPGTCRRSAWLIWSNSDIGTTTVDGDSATDGEAGCDLEGEATDMGGKGSEGSARSAAYLMHPVLRTWTT